MGEEVEETPYLLYDPSVPPPFYCYYPHQQLPTLNTSLFAQGT